MNWIILIIAGFFESGFAFCLGKMKGLSGTAWTLFAAAWTSVLGYSAATIYYRVATFVENPMYSIVAIACCAAALVGMYFWMRSFAKRDAGKGPKVIPIYAAK